MSPSMFLLLQGVNHSTPPFASSFRSLLEALKGKILLSYFLMSFHVGFLLFHSLYISFEAPNFVKLLQTVDINFNPNWDCFSSVLLLSIPQLPSSHPNWDCFIICAAQYVFDECLTSHVVFAGGNVRCCPFNPIFYLYFFLEALKFKVRLSSLLMPFHFRFFLYHSLFVLIYLAIVTFSSCFCLDQAPFH